ncbi:unnamed protein product [Penicillium salamii]|uniref:HSF-type DNA-binding domain-containing protein n=1 Tax=Penicillium salamii TaxID=1612424 RepID=A0A9W4N8X0_9EURO|nr:unnamed protein product [Penicillium salamii]CAG8288480.1 unnamed protein product [Penicillium salamii]CAG8294046.1 unnamed protein product [Penicillium salamii]CAG8307172.1 unnamed protein product [Penicillium salamii]CAG8317318.1 unnamed protein product [Penicillium salamii]
MMTTVSNEECGDGRCQTIDNIVDNYISEHHDKSLRPLRLANISIFEFSTELSNHLSVLNEGGSIALGRGEELASKSLSLQSLFSITTPPVRDGPPLTWTRLVLFAGPQFEGPAPTNVVLEQISLVARHLRNHRDLITRLFEDKHHANHRGEALPLDDASFSFSNGGSIDPVASAEHESSGYRYSPYTPTAIGYASNDRSSQPVDQELSDPALSEGAFAGNNTQRDGSGPEKDARPGFRLHTSDFIQCLSEILDDPKNGDVMRWSENGQSVYVAPESKLPAHILTKMSTKSHQSLVRRLYYFGFHKTGGVFHHESFSRGQPSSIRPTRELSHSPSLPTPLRNSASQRGPRYKVIKRKRARESV